MAQPRELVLASTSRYRRELLARLGLAFESLDPGVEETALAGEAPAETATRLSIAKARAVAARRPGALIVGADQVAALGARRFAKPGSHHRAREQLQALSGQRADFHTAVCLLDAKRGTAVTRVVPCAVTFRTLVDADIEAYLLREQPYDCAASAKAEGLGIALIERIDTADPTSLIGLPLIALTELLGQAGMPVLAA
jgi:septum formation protein